MRPGDLTPLFEVLCVEWGFCLSADALEAIEAALPLTGEGFADIVLRAEGVAEPDQHDWRIRIATRFERFFGDGSTASEA